MFIVRRYFTRRAVMSVPPLTASTPDGAYARASGVVRLIEALEAPLTGLPCAAYHARARGREHPKGPGRSVAAARLVMFALDRDNEPSIIVDGSHVTLALPRASHRLIRAARAATFTAMRGSTAGMAANASLLEVHLAAGARVWVAGTVMHDAPLEPDLAERHFRDRGAPTIRLAGNAAHPLVIAAA